DDRVFAHERYEVLEEGALAVDVVEAFGLRRGQAQGLGGEDAEACALDLRHDRACVAGCKRVGFDECEGALHGVDARNERADASRSEARLSTWCSTADPPRWSVRIAALRAEGRSSRPGRGGDPSRGGRGPRSRSGTPWRGAVRALAPAVA